jgi:hypothetical protein
VTVTRTRLAAQTYAYGLVGKSRDRLPVPWTNSKVMDDCAAFCSHVIWGGKPGPILWVDNFKTAGDGSYVPGSADLAPMDVLLFDWEGNGVGNHVEFMVGDLGNGYVRTYGANGADTRAAAYRLRPKHYILGRFRARWSTAAVAGPEKAPLTTTEQEEIDMLIIGNSKGQGLLTDSALIGFESPSDVRAMAKAGVKSVTVSDKFYAKLQREMAKR